MKDAPRTAPVLRWPGGKRRLVPQLLPLLATPHTLYCEPFAGGLALLLAKDRSGTEVVNDLNGDLVALYRCAQFHLEALIAEFEFTVGSRQNLTEFREQPGLTDLQRAARFLAINRFSFSGNHETFAVSRTTPGISSRANVIAALRALNARLDRVAVEHLTWQRCLALYDSPGSLFFLDPPYLHADTHIYRGWSEENMREMAAALDALKGTWVLTVDDSPFCRELFVHHDVTAVSSRNGLVRNTGKNVRFGELIIRPRATRPTAAAGKTRGRAA
jgi:DNA adenine methylase